MTESDSCLNARAKVDHRSKVKTNCQYLVVGLGLSGLSCVRFLKSYTDQVKVVDSRMNPPLLQQARDLWPKLDIQLGDFQAQDFNCADEIIISPGVSTDIPIIKTCITNNIPVYGDVELFLRHAQAPVIAVTGSNGKSTTVSLVAAILREHGFQVELGGNIGVPALDLLSKPNPDYYVLELSSFQLDTTYSLKAHAAVVLNVSEDHMDRYADLAAYRNSKLKIYKNAKNVIVDVDNPIPGGPDCQLASCITYAMSSDQAKFSLVQVNAQSWLSWANEPVININELKIAGKHNVQNVLAAIALASTTGVSRSAVINTLKSFTGLEHRMQWLTESNGVSWYNDSKGTNVGATIAAIDGLDCPVVLIAGGQAKGADLSVLRPVVANKVRAVVLIGEDADMIERELQNVVPVQHASSMDEAVAKAHALAKSGDAVLLSPACASFDMFENYMHRGKCFADSLHRYLTK